MRLIHYTCRRNLDGIKKTRELRCASSLMNAGEKKIHAGKKRPESTQCEATVLRDQQPLTERIVFSDGTTFPEFVEYLNEHVFFWPDSHAGEQAREGFRNKYSYSEEQVGLRCQLDDLIAENPGMEILFSRYNSGATPRSPRKSPRCRKLFQPLKARNGSRLVEVVAHGKVRLPDDTEWECDEGRWSKFFARH